MESNYGGLFSLSYWRSVFNRRPDYNVILQQRDLDPQGQVEASATFVLHESSAVESSQQAFEKVRSTLEPLLDDGSVMMTEELLEEIITPNPREASRLVFDLVEIMEKSVCISKYMYMYFIILPRRLIWGGIVTIHKDDSVITGVHKG